MPYHVEFRAGKADYNVPHPNLDDAVQCARDTLRLFRSVKSVEIRSFFPEYKLKGWKITVSR